MKKLSLACVVALSLAISSTGFASAAITGNPGLYVGGAPASATNPVPTTVQVTNATPSDCSGTIATGGTAQTLMASNLGRRWWMIQNQSSAPLYFNNMGSSAVQAPPSFVVQPNSSYESSTTFTSGAAISIIGPTTGQAFACEYR